MPYTISQTRGSYSCLSQRHVIERAKEREGLKKEERGHLLFLKKKNRRSNWKFETKRKGGKVSVGTTHKPLCDFECPFFCLPHFLKVKEHVMCFINEKFFSWWLWFSFYLFEHDFMMLTIHCVVLKGINVVSKLICMVYMVCSQHGLCLVHA